MSRAPLTLKSETGEFVSRITIATAPTKHEWMSTLRFQPRQDEDGRWHIHDAELDEYVRAPWDSQRHWTAESKQTAELHADTLNRMIK